MAYFDGRLSSIEPYMHTTTNDIDTLKREIYALHEFLSRMGVQPYNSTTGHTLLLAERLEILFGSPGWEPIKKENQNGG